ncbi:winged helix-turn-helix transcriptional regulator [Candidatus Gottesmanbacteria bacterium]|nr:winged helix-turn-helix transcriptional regulator [Candidatus Gottesmanbacteria bacterium]
MFNRSYIIGHNGHPHYFTDARISVLQKQSYSSKNDGELLHILKQLSDQTKWEIYVLLHHVLEISVNDIAHILKLSPSRASHALSDLRFIGLVEAHRCGKLMCYSLAHKRWLRRFARFVS